MSVESPLTTSEALINPLLLSVPNMHGKLKMFDGLCLISSSAGQFDSVGNTGGCQATYTVIPSLSTPNCSNITFPPLLDVQATVDTGLMSQFGWVDQVSDQNHSSEAVIMCRQVH